MRESSYQVAAEVFSLFLPFSVLWIIYFQWLITVDVSNLAALLASVNKLPTMAILKVNTSEKTRIEGNASDLFKLALPHLTTLKLTSWIQNLGLDDFTTFCYCISDQNRENAPGLFERKWD